MSKSSALLKKNLIFVSREWVPSRMPRVAWKPMSRISGHLGGRLHTGAAGPRGGQGVDDQPKDVDGGFVGDVVERVEWLEGVGEGHGDGMASMKAQRPGTKRVGVGQHVGEDARARDSAID
jgi:hypothetical protein